MSPYTAVTKRANPGLRFFVARDASDLAAALAWADEHATADAAETWDQWGADPKAWVTLRLPAPRLHPRAPELLAAEAGVSPLALRAVLERAAYIADDGELRLWPWYLEEDTTERARAERRAIELGVALPGELLDEPYQPAHYLARSGMPAIASWLEGRGIAASAALIDRIPLPPKMAHPAERYEGGLRATSRVNQAIGALLQAVRMFGYVTSDEDRVTVERQTDQALARVFSAIDTEAPPFPRLEAESESVIDAPMPSTDAEAVPGRVGSIYALPSGGALLVCDGAFIEIDRAGAFVAAWPMMLGSVVVCGDIVIVNGDAVLDLAAGRFLDAGGSLAAILARVGLPDVPAPGDHERERVSACGRYQLDSSPAITRLADGIVIAEGDELARALGTQDDEDKPKRRPRGEALVAAEALEIARPTIIDGVKFVVRAGQAPARDGQALAFALVDSRWRFLSGDEIREGGKTLARLGVPVCSGAFRADGGELWALSSDHAIRVELAGTPRVATVAALAPLLSAAARVLPPVVRDA